MTSEGRPFGEKSQVTDFWFVFDLGVFRFSFHLFFFHSGRWNHGDINMFFSKTHGPRNAEIQVANVRVFKKES